MLDENGTPRTQVRALNMRDPFVSLHTACSLELSSVSSAFPHSNLQPAESRWSYDRVRSSDSESTTARKGDAGRIDIGGKIKNVLEVSPLMNSTFSGFQLPDLLC
jgi:hypothetical protein